MEKQAEKGLPSLKEAVTKECTTEGCTTMHEDGCMTGCKATHRACDKYKWVITRAAQYAKKTGKTIAEIVAAWEQRRSYWYMNYYQECNQPDLGGGIKVILYEDWVKELNARFGKDPREWKFKCPACGNIQCGKDFENAGENEWRSKVYYNCIGRYVKNRACNWTLGGLLQIHSSIVVTQEGNIVPVFEMADADIKQPT